LDKRFLAIILAAAVLIKGTTLVGEPKQDQVR